MEKVQEISLRMLYRGILKGARIYPSKNREMMMQAIIEDVQDWKKLEKGSLEAKKAIKRMKMLYGHLNMWNEKMVEINDNSTDRVDKPMPLRDINRKEDEDFVYF
jgi:hypothetical protein